MTDNPQTTPVCPRCGYQTDGFICTKCAAPQIADKTVQHALADERAWNAATNEVIEAARIVAHGKNLLVGNDAYRLFDAVTAMEKLEQEAAKRIEIEREQQRGGAA